MSLANTPFLVAILSAVTGLVKTIWDCLAKALSRSAFIVGVILPWVLRQIVKFRVFTVLIAVLLGLQFIAVFRRVLSLCEMRWQLWSQADYLFSQMKWMGFLLWDGPLNLKHMYARIPDVLAVAFSLMGIKFLFRKVAWLKFLTEQKVKS